MLVLDERSATRQNHDDNHLAPEAVAHSERFREVSNRYPRLVAEAYSGDLRRAAAATDAEVSATVAEWARANGLPVRDWSVIGAAEGKAAQA
jgi:hypothetical protein